MQNLFKLALESSPEDLARDDLMQHSFGRTPNKLDVIRPSGPALEEVADGKVFKEIEHTIYGRIVNPLELKNAKSMEKHEQWETRIAKTDKNAGEGSIRVRKTWVEGGDPTYVRTAKVKVNDKGDKLELPLPSSEDEFTIMKFFAEQGLIKDRYFFPIEGSELVWEVDMFPKVGGGYHEWVKIDLEVKDRDAPIPELPIELADVIMPKGYGRQDDGKADELLTQIYDEFFIAKNAFLNPPQEETPPPGVNPEDDPDAQKEPSQDDNQSPEEKQPDPEAKPEDDKEPETQQEPEAKPDEEKKEGEEKPTDTPEENKDE